MSTEGNSSTKYDEDPRPPCRYGVKCYQKNEPHRKKYKHLPAVEQKKIHSESETKKRTRLDRDKDEEAPPVSSDGESDSEIPETKKLCAKDDSVTASPFKSTAADIGAESSAVVDHKKIIRDKFLVEMPGDFYQFYELCKEISPGDPCNAFKVANLLLVGPFDVLNGKLLNAKIEDKAEYLRHWRYFYDPPEFQTIIKGNDKEGLHFGYWRDDPKEHPVFVAKNLCKINCKINPVAETIFGAVDNYLEERLKIVNPFEKPKYANLRQRLRKFATAKDVKLDKGSDSMRARERLVVARTFHGAGIVVPYDKKTQLGYRELAATDANLKKILSRLDEAKDEDERSAQLAHLEEVERLATIAADECDFGTCLELGHDLFSSGNKHVQSIATRMFSTAYTLLKRSEFLEIVKAHGENRQEGSALGIV